MNLEKALKRLEGKLPEEVDPNEVRFIEPSCQHVVDKKNRHYALQALKSDVKKIKDKFPFRKNSELEEIVLAQ